MTLLIWFGIVGCALQAALFSGLNLAYFSIPYLQLKARAERGDRESEIVLKLRNKPNFLLATILWGNVSFNVLLTLLSSSVLAGVVSFLFSTVVLTLVGEILPQAIFSRSALKWAARLAPMIYFYQFLLYPIAKPTAWALDRMFGPVRPQFYTEADLVKLIEAHLDGALNLDISEQEGRGAIAFLKLDDQRVADLGRTLASNQILKIKVEDLDLPVSADVMKRLTSSESFPLVLSDLKGKPLRVLSAEDCVKMQNKKYHKKLLHNFGSLPMIISDEASKMNAVISVFTDTDERNSVVLFWTKDRKKIIEPADLLSPLLIPKN